MEPWNNWNKWIGLSLHVGMFACIFLEDDDPGRRIKLVILHAIEPMYACSEHPGKGRLQHVDGDVVSMPTETYFSTCARPASQIQAMPEPIGAFPHVETAREGGARKKTRLGACLLILHVFFHHDEKLKV